MKTETIKLLFIFAAVVFLSSALYAQPDSITNKTWYKKINQTFGSVATGQGDAVNLANYGSFEPANGAYKFNLFGPLGNTEKKKVPFFNVNITGKVIGDNSSVLFSNSKFNSGTTFGAKLHFPISPFPVFSGNEMDTINRKVKLLTDDTINKKRQYREEFSYERLRIVKQNDSVKLVNIKTQISRKVTEIDTIKNQLQRLSASDTVQLLKLTDSYLDLFKKKQHLLSDSIILADRITTTDTLLVDDNLRKQIINGLGYVTDTAYKSKRDALEMSVTVKGYTMLWVTIVANIERKKYYNFKDVLPFAEQLARNKFTRSTIGLELNFTSFTGKKGNPLPNDKASSVSIGNIGLVRTHNNNIDDLSTTELSDSRKFTSRDSTHSLATKYNVYTDDITEYNAWNLYGNYYYSLGKSRTIAIHIFPDVEFRDTKEYPFNVGFGMIFSIKNKKDNSLLNVEIFGKLIDVGKALPQDEKSLINRNQIGINFGVPINLVNKKN